MRAHAFTIAAPNYFHRVAVLFRSLRRHHPDWRLHLIVADDPATCPAPGAVAADEVHGVDRLGVEDWRPWAFGHDLVELATALKPFALARLLERDEGGAVVYLDPDVAVYSPLDEALAVLADGHVALTPHQTAPAPTRAGILADEICSLQHGVYNLGFIAVRASDEGRRFAGWWAERLRDFCRISLADGLYTDQRWIDLAPAFFEGVRILRSERYNVSVWNLATRRVTRSLAGEWLVNGQPLGFYHFSAIENGAHHLAAAAQGPALLELLREYERDAGPPRASAWRMARFEDGAVIDRAQRHVYRLRADLKRHFPDPYRSGPLTFQDWWARCAEAEYPRLFDAAAKAAEAERLSRAFVTDLF